MGDRSNRSCSRRSFLRIGLGGLPGMYALGGLPLGVLLGDERPKVRRSVVYVLLAGGPSHIDTFDAKPEAAVEYRGEFGAIATAVPGVHFAEHVPLLARDVKRFALLRAVSHETIVHESGQRLILTGTRNANPEVPSLGAVNAHFAPTGFPPPHVAVPMLPPNAGELGQSCESYNLLGESGQLVKHGPRSNDRAAILAFNRRNELLSFVDQQFEATGKTSEAMHIRREAYTQAATFLQSDALRSASDLSQESEATRDLYGRTECGDYLLLARRMVELGTSFVTVSLGGWDTHVNGFKTLRDLLPPLDQALSALLADLQQRGLLESTMVVALGEFGRTPRVNSTSGRDHWPRAMSVLMGGGGIRGGQVLGATDGIGAESTAQPLIPEDVACTVLAHLGVDPATATIPPTGRRLITSGRALTELYK